MPERSSSKVSNLARAWEILRPALDQTTSRTPGIETQVTQLVRKCLDDGGKEAESIVRAISAHPTYWINTIPVLIVADRIAYPRGSRNNKDLKNAAKLLIAEAESRTTGTDGLPRNAGEILIRKIVSYSLVEEATNVVDLLPPADRFPVFLNLVIEFAAPGVALSSYGKYLAEYKASQPDLPPDDYYLQNGWINLFGSLAEHGDLRAVDVLLTGPQAKRVNLMLAEGFRQFKHLLRQGGELAAELRSQFLADSFGLDPEKISNNYWVFQARAAAVVVTCRYEGMPACGAALQGMRQNDLGAWIAKLPSELSEDSEILSRVYDKIFEERLCWLMRDLSNLDRKETPAEKLEKCTIGLLKEVVERGEGKRGFLKLRDRLMQMYPDNPFVIELSFNILVQDGNLEEAEAMFSRMNDYSAREARVTLARAFIDQSRGSLT